jgi:hypothetical protein
MDRWNNMEFFRHLTGKVYLSHYMAIMDIDPDVLKTEADQFFICL